MSIPTLTLVTGSQCNLACSYCYQPYTLFGAEHRQLRPQTVQRALQWYAKQFGDDSIQINFYGGEPLLAFNILQSACEAATALFHHIKFECVTNGTLINSRLLAWAERYHINFVLSLDGPESIHDTVRVDWGHRGSYKRVIAFYYQAMAAGLPVRFNTVVTAPQSLGDIYEHLMSLWGQVSDTTVQFIPEYGLSPLSFDVYDYENKLFDIGIKSVSSHLKIHNISTLIGHFLEGRKSYNGKLACGAGTTQFALLPNGQIYPCHRFAIENWSDASIVSDDVSDFSIEASDAFTPVERCRHCDIADVCRGGCLMNIIGPNEQSNPSPFYCATRRAEVHATQKIYETLWNTRPIEILGLFSSSASSLFENMILESRNDG